MKRVCMSDLELQTLGCIFSHLSIASVHGKQHLSDVVFSALVAFHRKKNKGFRVVPVPPGLVTSDYGVHVGVTVCGVQHVVGVRVRPGNQIVQSFSLQ